MHRALDRLDGMLHIEDRRGDTCGVDDEIEILAKRERIGHIRPYAADVWIVSACRLMRCLIPGNEIIDGNQCGRCRQDFRVETFEKGGDVAAKKARSAREENRFPRETLRVPPE